MTSQFTARCEQSEDREDLRQEAILGFYKALTRYNTDQTEVQFGLYAKECIRNRLTSYLRRIKKYEQIRPLEDEGSEMIEDAEQDPVNRIVEQENYLELYNRVCSMLSDYENRVWWMYLSGRTAAEIASKLGKDEKSVQNAIYRIRRKLRSVIPYP
jgi:RNA polymerase sporulation-specific sigma factor